MTPLTAVRRRFRALLSPGLPPALGRAVAPLRRLAAPLGRALAPLARRALPLWRAVTPVGRVAVVGAVGGLAAGLRYGWEELVVLGGFLTVTLLVAVGWVISRATFEARIHLTRHRVTVGEHAIGHVAVRNRGSATAPGRTFELPVGLGVGRFDVPRLGPGEEYESPFTIPARRRCVLVLGPVRAVRTDPLRLLQQVRRWSDPVELFVHPRTVPLGGENAGFLRDLEGVATSTLSSSDVSFYALRPYVPGDDRRAVHWRTTARVGTLMIRQFEETQRSHLLLVLSQRSGDYADADEFETAVSSVASMAAQAFREDREVSVVTSHGRVRAASRIGLFDQLAALELGPGEPTLTDVATTAATEVPQASIACLVTGSTIPVPELRGAHVRLPVDVHSLAVRVTHGKDSSRSRLGDLTVIDVPTLDDLPRALRAAR